MFVDKFVVNAMLMTNKTFNIISKDKSQVVNKINKLMTNNGFKKEIKNPKYVFVLGGDGTFIKTINKFYSKEVNLIHINTGNIGFYSKFNSKKLPSINQITNESNYINPDVLLAKAKNKYFNAINEIAIKSTNTISCDIYINNTFYESFRGSGLLVSTKTGSTGFCKSALGSIIFPTVDAYELVELFPTLHAKKNSISSPIVLGTKSKITIKNILSNYSNSLITDGIERTCLSNEDSLNIEIIKPKFKLLFTKNESEYIKKIQETFING